ncbi:MAG TPA: L,D-transpeptidase family protein [Thermoanaerobaculia bacterium]|nr:L,D-transpeptidase family protein [Thermoanaerobaculia bacterium]
MAPERSERPRVRALMAGLVVALVLAGVAAAFGGGWSPDLLTAIGLGRIGGGAPEDTRRAFAGYLERRPDSRVVTGFAGPGEREGTHQALVAFYEANGHHPAWFDGRRPSREARELVELLRRAGEHGLDPLRYRPELLEAKLEELGRRPAYREIYPVDTLLSQAFALYGRHLASGRVHPDSLGPAWLIEPRRVRLPRSIELASGGSGPAAVADRLRPPHPGYERLFEGLERYRRITAEGGWPKVPAGPILTEGDRAPAARLRALAARLAVEGYSTNRGVGPGRAAAGENLDEAQEAVYGTVLAEAVHRFQQHHGITEDGHLGPETMAALNVPAAQRVHQLELNLERWRWLPAELGPRRLEVNLPAYSLSLIENGRTVETIKVVVGKEGAATPAFSDQMGYVVINPYWNVPESITAAEIAPNAAADPSWLSRNGYEVVEGWGEEARPIDPHAVDWSAAQHGDLPYLVRQPPGPGNALGDIKFMFPNDHNIYLHDTPATHLFDEVERTFSHGCIRVERPLDLAEFVLEGDPQWDRSRVEQAIASGRTMDLPLPRKIPVYLLYWTAWVDEDGATHFRKDIYRHDRALSRALAGQRAEASSAPTSTGGPPDAMRP